MQNLYAGDPAEWPAHSSETRPWQASGRGPKADRMLKQIEVSIPPMIENERYTPGRTTSAALETATQSIIALDRGSGERLKSLAQFLIRTESVSSSKIEYIEADVDDYARAMAGIKSNESAVSMVAATSAIQQMISAAGDHDITLDDVLGAHHALMHEDPMDGHYAGQLRTVQNWIGGSDHSPRGAVHVPPPPELVPALMRDLIVFANRDDMSAVAQAAIVHAQFESIHPFTDGNGRIGRALINAVLRRRRLTTQTITPLASAMVADRQGYFDLINNYRRGDLTPFVQNVALSAHVASNAAQTSAEVLEQLPALWQRKTNYRAGSAASVLLGSLLEQPILTAETAIAITKGPESSVYTAMDQLERDGIVHEVTNRKRNKVWAATDVMDEMAELANRIEKSANERVNAIRLPVSTPATSTPLTPEALEARYRRFPALRPRKSQAVGNKDARDPSVSDEYQP